MGDTNLISMAKIDRLVGRNYIVWAMKVASILRAKRLFNIVIELETPPECTDSSKPEYNVRKIWEEKNDEAFGLLILSLSDEQAGMFVGETNAKKVWEVLKKMYSGNQQDRVIDINLEIKGLIMHNSETVDEYVTRAKGLVAKMNSLGGSITEREIVFYLVRGLSKKWEHIAIVLRTNRSATIDEVHQCLREEEMRIEGRNWSENGYGRGEKAFKGEETKRTGNKKCYICDKVGHIAKQCWHRYGNKMNVDKNVRGGKDTHSSHGNGKINASVANKSRNEYAFSVDQDDVEISKKKKEMEWNLDSGCTTHMTFQREHLINVEEYESDINMAEKGRVIKATAKGEIRMNIKTNGENKIIRMKEVLYVPKLKSNLMSVKGLIERNNEVHFNKNGALIQTRCGEIVAKATEENNMYVIRSEVIKEEESMVTEENKSNKREADNEQSDQKSKDSIWHLRLGHVNNAYLKVMKDRSIVRGLDQARMQYLTCESCILGKMVQNAFKPKMIKSTKQPLELVHMDLCGPMITESLGGNKYMFVIIDDYSRRIFLKLLREKSETYEAFVDFKKRVENKSGKSIMNVRTDNGTEFVNHKFESLFNAEGIKHERTVPYTPASNGVAERANRSIIEMARTLLINAELPKEFWGEAVKTAVYIKNRIYREGIGENTPMELWNDYKPTVAYFKVFGCMAYYHVPRQNRSKWESRAKGGIFVGYSECRKAYRIYVPETNKIVESRSVRFDEGCKGMKLLNRKAYLNSNLDEIIYTTEDEDKQITRTGNERKSEGIEVFVNFESDAENIERNENGDKMENKRGRPSGIITQIDEEARQRQNEEREERLITHGARRSMRLRERVEANLTRDGGSIIPGNYEEAMKSKECGAWKKAMEEEIDSLNQHEVWEVVTRNEGKKVLPTKWVYSVKGGNEEQTKRYKARLVVMGCNQRKGIDYEESYSPVLRVESLRLLIALAAKRNMVMRRYDVKTAYLYSELDEEIYIHQPQGIPRKEGKMLKLRKSLYGLPQSGYNWNKKLNGVLIEIGFERMGSDPCLYRMENDEGILIIGVYVDDGIVVGTSDEMIKKMMDKVKENFIIREEEASGIFLGIEIDKIKGGYELSQEKQIEKLLTKYGMEECNPVKTPVDTNQNWDECEDSIEVKCTEYQELIGSLMYISNRTRPDICYGVNRLAQFSKKPKEIHLGAAKRIVRYLKGTKHYKLRFDGAVGVVTGCSDASWCSTAEAKSHTGYCVTWGNALISWGTKKQNLVALSSCEAEVVALCETVREINWVKNIMEELKIEEYVKRPIIIQTDSQAGIDWVKGKSVKQRSKHFNRKCYYIRDEIEEGNIDVKYKSTKDLEADMLTKAVPSEKLKVCRLQLNLRD